MNNAGISVAGKPFREMTEKERDLMMNINFKGILTETQYIAKMAVFLASDLASEIAG